RLCEITALWSQAVAEPHGAARETAEQGWGSRCHERLNIAVGETHTLRGGPCILIRSQIDECPVPCRFASLYPIAHLLLGKAARRVLQSVGPDDDQRPVGAVGVVFPADGAGELVQAHAERIVEGGIAAGQVI